MTSEQRPALVIVGNGMVGQRLVDELISRNGHDHWSIHVIGEESHRAYDRVALSSWFDGRTVSDLSLVDDVSVEQAGIDYHVGLGVTTIDRDRKQLALSDGSAMAYDHLVLATGSVPFVPPIPGWDREGCFVYRTIDDLEAIAGRALEAGTTSGVVIGGGLLGLEAANALLHLGLEAHVVEMAPHLMPQQLTSDASAMLARHVEALGVHLHLGAATAAILGDDPEASEAPGAVGKLQFADGSEVEAQLLIFSAGIRPRDELARACGLDIGERGGVVVDESLVTADPAVSAVGEVASYEGRTYGLVAPGYQMARVIADRLVPEVDPSSAGAPPASEFTGGDLAAKLKLLGVDVASFGLTHVPDDRVGSYEHLVFSDPVSMIHRELIVDQDGQVAGGMLVGDASGYQTLRMLAAEQAIPPPQLAPLLLPDGLVPAAPGAASTQISMADEVQVCTCNNVSASQVRAAVVGGALTAQAVGACTNAGTSCGGCVPMVAGLVEATLLAEGHAVDRSLCEHFGYSRQELFDLVRVKRHSSWNEVIAAHGTGHGCAICRPAVASMLASMSNGYVLDGDQGAIQDTNDHALANMQRNGTYSVVPRVPGGEITADQLIALGTIAKEFGLYCKITGGQRVDLFGAQLHELPEIWRLVIAAGLESGHAYGKALRTIKSCVGTTWCRYGVQDSVSMAIRLERRYRGLRSPHKLKSAVSGCTRECAEAQSKDFGVIATESGWNLYVGGNGGKTPRHADLFASDLDDETLVAYIDRFLMFYIRTADRLERTSVWLGKLDGGVDYLRTVVIDDVLGIADDLEADLQRHVDSYECEWTATLADPERLSHFVEFVNAPDQTTTPVWITERTQRVPSADLVSIGVA